MTRYFALLVVLLLAFGCGQASVPTTPVGTDGQLPANEVVFPNHTPVAVVINNRKYGESSGCTTTFVPQLLAHNSQVKHTLTCGHPGAVSKLTWEYAGTGKAGDNYRFRRQFPYKESNEESSSKDIVYTGREQLLFEDDHQSITIRPESGDE